MKVGALTLYLHLLQVATIKEKRSIVKHLIHRIHNHGPAYAAAEVANNDDLDQAVIGVTHISNSAQRTQSALDRLGAELESSREYILEERDIEFL